jgi:EAL domain-containing protein (putative c-di-GMP-specific phosphodiesterase class I)
LNGLSAADVVHQADLAMYHAKRSGRGRVQVHDSVIAGARRREQQLVIDMVRSLERGGHDIGVHLQPIHSLAERRMVGAEVLARWRHADLGPVPPIEFISAAERTGNIRPLGRHLFQSAFRNIGAWGDAVSDLVFNVNVSPLQLQHEGFATDLLALLQEAGIPPTRLACEITESALLGDEVRVSRVLAQLVESGVRMVLDDFGTGYASLSTLMRHPFSGIKIDHQFIRGVVSNPASRAIFRSVITLSRDLGLSCTAEGVEQPDQLQLLEDLGCPLVQGRWICDAIPPHDFVHRVRGTVQRD